MERLQKELEETRSDLRRREAEVRELRCLISLRDLRVVEEHDVRAAFREVRRRPCCIFHGSDPSSAPVGRLLLDTASPGSPAWDSRLWALIPGWCRALRRP